MGIEDGSRSLKSLLAFIASPSMRSQSKGGFTSSSQTYEHISKTPLIKLGSVARTETRGGGGRAMHHHYRQLIKEEFRAEGGLEFVHLVLHIRFVHRHSWCINFVITKQSG